MPANKSEDQLYAKIEKRFKFSFPSDYREMRNLDWMTLVRPVDPATFKVPGRNYLWINDMEWYSLKEIDEFEFADYTKPRLPNLVPFAFTGGGSPWCWQTDHGMRVLHCARDCYDGEIYAPNFTSALFRQALEFAQHGESSTTPDVAVLWEEKRALLNRWAIDLGPFFPPEWRNILQDLSTRKPKRWEWSTRWGKTFVERSLLPQAEREKIENDELNFPDLGKPIRWQNLDK